jgi:hypothetical protein
VGGAQITDYNPGIKPSGLFWTMAMDASAFEIIPGKGKARFKVDNMPMPNFHDFGNSISPNPTSVPGHVSFEVTWTGGGGRARFRNDEFDYAAELVYGSATISFSASDDGGNEVYTSDAAGQYVPWPWVPAAGKERNGAFFN